MFPQSHYQPQGGRVSMCTNVCVSQCCNVTKCDSEKMWVYPSAATILSTVWQPLFVHVCMCVCMLVCIASVHQRVVGEEKARDKHLQAAIMGNFPTAAKLKPPKTKQRGQIYSLDDSVNDAQREKEKKKEREREMTVIHTKLQAASITQILTSNVRHVVESLCLMQRLIELPHLFPLVPP